MKSSTYFCFILTLVSLFHPVLVFSDESSSELSRADQKLILIEAKVNRLKTLQEKIRQKQAEVDEQLDTLKVWIARS